MKKRLHSTFSAVILTVSLIAALTACGADKNTAENTENKEAANTEGISSEENGSSEENKSSEEHASSQTSPYTEEMQQVIDAIEGTSAQSSFAIDTSAELVLSGKAISGDYHMLSEVHVAQEQDHDDMQMSMETTTDMDDIVTYACYQDGWYYVDGADGKQKEEKTADEVLSLISGVTDLVKESASKIDSVDVAREEGSMVYTYELPAYLAEDYLGNMVDALKNDDLTGAQIHIDQAILVSRVDDATGLLTEQSVHITGTVHKMIFTVPAEAEITADFEIPDTEKPDIRTW